MFTRTSVVQTEISAHIFVLCAITVIEIGISDKALIGYEIHHCIIPEIALAAPEFYVEVVS